MSVAIVTGGAKGIGKAIATSLAEKGIKVVINYNTSEEQAKELKNYLIDKGHQVQIYKADVSKKEEVKKLVEFTKNSYGSIDILVNNAGIDLWKMFIDTTEEEWEKVLKTNLTSAFYTTQEVIKDMVSNKKGCIINISSIDGITGASCEVAYSVSKAGLDGLTKALAKELAPSNIRINSVAPGAIDTDMNDKEDLKEAIKEIPMRKIGKPEDIAKCVMWLVEDEYTTGQIISPNGGWVI